MATWFDLLVEKAFPQKNANKSWLDDSSSVFIYGTGTFAQDIFRTLIETGICVSGFLDHRQSASSFLHGMHVLHPEFARDACVLIGIHNRDADILSIIRKLEEYGAAHIVLPVEIYDICGNSLGSRFWLTERSFYLPCKPAIEKAYSLLADEVSQALYSSILEFRLTGDYTVLPTPDYEHQYFPLDIPSWKTPLRLVDCGAFDGDTLSAFMTNGIKIDAVAAFEPDLANFAKLSQFISAHRHEMYEVMLLPCGVYSYTTRLTFESGRESASNISSVGTTMIQCVALDDAIPTFAPNLIKMDIEGSEYDALLGARHIISVYIPSLAISLYHRPEHLWQIPLIIDSIAPGKYKFYLRSHALNDFELVLYAVPLERKANASI